MTRFLLLANSLLRHIYVIYTGNGALLRIYVQKSECERILRMRRELQCLEEILCLRGARGAGWVHRKIL
jgi:hypothetical protein